MSEAAPRTSDIAHAAAAASGVPHLVYTSGDGAAARQPAAAVPGQSSVHR